MFKRISLALASLFIVAGVSLAQYWPSLPIVGGASYCITYVNAVCTATVPAGPTALTSAYYFPADTGAAASNAIQSAKVPIGTLSNYARGTGLLYSTGVAVTGIAGTSEQTLATYSIPADTLISGRMIRVKSSFSAAGNGNTKTFKCYFGASVITSSTLTTNAKNGSCEVNTFWITAASQMTYANMLVDTTPITGYVNAGTDSTAAAVVVKMTFTGATSGVDGTMNAFSVELLGQ